MNDVKEYGHLRGYLHRWRLFGIGRFMLRWHQILSPDHTPFLHTHPFSYVSVVVRGGYTERLVRDGQLITVKRKMGSIAFRHHSVLHRIDSVEPNCATLIFCWRRADAPLVQGWRMQRHPEITPPQGYWDAPDGLYRARQGFRKRQQGCWYACRSNAEAAIYCERLSLRQDFKPTEMQMVDYK